MSGNSLAMMPWFARDYLAATRAMRLAERGAYCDLLFYQWEMGSLPADPKSLARLLGAERQEFESVWKIIRCKFVKQGTGLINLRLEEHRVRAIAQRQKKIEAAKKTNQKRYGERPINGSHSASLSDTHSASPPSPSPSPSPNSNPTHDAREKMRKESEQIVADHMTAIRTEYPLAARPDWITGEKNARNLVLRDEATWTALRAGVRRYAAFCRATGRIVLNPARFFGDVDRPWSHDWTIPTTKPDRPRPDDSLWNEAKSRAAAIQFRDPWPQESAAAYMTAIKLQENSARGPPKKISELATRLRVSKSP